VDRHSLSSKKCVTLCAPLFFVFSELHGNLLDMVCRAICVVVERAGEPLRRASRVAERPQNRSFTIERTKEHWTRHHAFKSECPRARGQSLRGDSRKSTDTRLPKPQNPRLRYSFSKSIRLPSRERWHRNKCQRGEKTPRLTLIHFGIAVYCGNYVDR
jgi:hypothetical protein